MKLDAYYRNESNIAPLVFVLSPRSNHTATFNAFVARVEMRERMQLIYYGQSEDRKAKKMIEAGKVAGNWILLMNCHL